MRWFQGADAVDLDTLKLFGFQPDMLPDELVLRKDTRAYLILAAGAVIGLLVAVGFAWWDEGEFGDFNFDWFDFEILIGPGLALLISPLVSLLVERFVPDDLLLDREGFIVQGGMEQKISWQDTTLFEVEPRSFWTSRVITYVPDEVEEGISENILREDMNRLEINAVYGRLDAEDLARVMNAYRGLR